eukprot:CAMPEP_0198222534 /NCGR_PEP_ID=MMETSP1445-20131203/88526_1 /TAXON_ID=36898 /ORGANISM="Pyramimonas sp., Strain CCMP2087" /LENGTH=183 /DNA_ID=CAMNT_0043901063 /DNA_START=22 /DNA_END=570 /DNA_ORIENTATION=-
MDARSNAPVTLQGALVAAFFQLCHGRVVAPDLSRPSLQLLLNQSSALLFNLTANVNISMEEAELSQGFEYRRPSLDGEAQRKESSKVLALMTVGVVIYTCLILCIMFVRWQQQKRFRRLRDGARGGDGDRMQDETMWAILRANLHQSPVQPSVESDRGPGLGLGGPGDDGVNAERGPGGGEPV